MSRVGYSLGPAELTLEASGWSYRFEEILYLSDRIAKQVSLWLQRLDLVGFRLS